MYNIKRNKKVLEYLNQQIKRLRWNISVTDVFNQYIFENLSVSDSKEILDEVGEEITHTVLDNDAVLMETLKFIGLMEVCVVTDELFMMIQRRKEIKYGNSLTDFDKILKAIMTVPNKEKE